MTSTSALFTTVAATLLLGCATGGDDDSSDDDATASWTQAIVDSPTADGCFQATYPSTTWDAVECTTAPTGPLRSRASAAKSGSDGATPDVVGDVADYELQVTGLISSATGTFAKITGLTSETDSLANAADSYSLQLNSNTMAGTAACNGASGCSSWEQFAYLAEGNDALLFIQNWLLDAGTCPTTGGWITYMNGPQVDCYMNGTAISAPQVPITALATIKLQGTAAKGGNDSVVFTVGKTAYKTTEPDSLTDLATAWHGAEYNVFGPGSGSQANLNAGASLTVGISVKDGSSRTAPKCAGNAGTTGETNNLTLGACTAKSGTTPSVQFTETD